MMRTERAPDSLLNSQVAPASGPRKRPAPGRRPILFALLLLPLLLASTATFSHAGTILYVNHTDPACQGHTPCYQTIQAAVDAAQAGDTIRIQAGTYQEQVNISGKNNVAGASEADRILIEADPAAPVGSVILQGAVTQCTNGYAIRLQQSKFITIRGLTITGAGGQAISLMGGNNQNEAIHIERNRIWSNGSPECSGGITIARGNPNSVILNNQIFSNGRNGITFIDADGGPHYLINNTIHSNTWSGVNVARSHEVHLVNNLITGNGTASGSTGGRFGVKREDSTSPQPAGITLLNNLLCGNRLGEIDGPALDATDANNLTPTGTEGPGVSASPGCEVSSNVYANLNGTDGQPNTADDDFTLATTSPAIDRGMDPRTLGLNPSFNALFEADFSGEGRRPRDGNASGTAEFDLGALEAGVTARPTISALNPSSEVHGKTFTLTITGERLGGATALTFLKDGTPDAAITSSNLATNPAGTELTATVTIAATAALGARVVTVTTPEGTSDATPTNGNTFTVLGQITLVPDFMSLVEGQTGGLTVQLSAPAPTGGLIVTLESANTTIATVPASVTVPAGATSAPTSVTGVFEGTTNITASNSAFASGQSVITVRAPVPTISSFNPSSGKVGTTVGLTGTGFRLTPSANTVRFTGPNSTWVAATVSAASSTSLTATVPTGSITGPLQVMTSGGTATSTGYFILLPTEDFQLTVAPATVTLPATGQGGLGVSVTGSGGFTNLATLVFSGLPAGATAGFAAPTLTAGQSTLLTVQTTGITAQGSYPLTVSATATLNGVSTTRTGTVTLEVQGSGVTSLTGRVLDEEGKPVKGAMVTLGTLQGPTDDAGNFLLLNPPAGADQLLLVDGTPASTAERNYPIIPYKVTIVAGQANTLAFTPHLHVQKTTGLVDISNGSVQRIVTDPSLPGLEMRVPAGVTITGWDGQPNTQVSLRKVPLDRNPLPPLPADRVVSSLYMYYFGKPGGGTPSAPVPIRFPNDLDLPPGTQVELWYYDEAPDGSRPNTWAQYGTGTVSTDGSQVLPDINPATGQPYGQPRFCCGAGFMTIVRERQQATNNQRGGDNLPPDGTCCGDPVEVSTGLFVLTQTDLALPGRLPIALSRTYRPRGAAAGPFGPGTSHPYHILLLVEFDLRTLLLPGGTRLAFPKQTDGTFRNTTDPMVRGAVLTETSGSATLRFKDGPTWTFGAPVFGTAFLLRQTDRNGNSLAFTRSGSAQNLVTITESGGREVTLTYDGSNRITTITDPLGRRVTYTYDAAGNLATLTDPAGGITRYTYDAQGRMLTVTDPRGIAVVQNEYDPAGLVIRQTRADGGIWTYAYTTAGATITQTVVTNPEGQRTTYRFTGTGYRVGTTDNLGQSSTTTRDPSTNQLLASTDPLGRTTQFTYDPAGNVTQLRDPLGQLWATTYEPTFSQPQATTDPLGNTTTFAYDPKGNLISVTDPLNHTTTFAYNAFGQPISITDPLGNTSTLEYDEVGNLTASTDPLGNRTERTYDAASRLLTFTDPKGAVTRFTYDALDRLVMLTDPLNGTTRFTYDSNGNLLTVTDAKGQTTSHTHDAMNRLATRTDALNRTETYTYDLNGNLKTVTDRKGQMTTHSYDAQDRRIRSDFADGTSLTYQYDPTGRLLTATDSQTGSIANSYDGLGRLTSQVTPQGSIVYAYDALGRRQTMQANGLPPVSYGYDAASRLSGITQGTQTVSLTYDAANRRSTLTLPNGITISYAYDPASRLIAQTYTGPQGVLGDLTYSHDAAGNRLATGGSWARTGIPGGIPTSSYDAVNQQLAFGNVIQTFDANGNLLTQTDASGTSTYIWDTRNRLSGISGPSVTASFAYDALGRRTSKSINGQTSTFQYDGLDILKEMSGEGVATYLRTRAIDEALTRIDGNGSMGYLGDALGSIVALADATSAITTEYTYEPYGETTAFGLPAANPFQFTGRENDGTGLYFYRARYYDAKWGRFLIPDPLGLKSDVNPYRYAADNPLRFVDRMGLAPRDSACEDCPGGEWKMDIRSGFTVGLIFGYSRTIIDFTCVSNGKKCRAFVNCGSVGAQAQGSWSPGSREFESIGTGTKVSGFSSSRSLRKGFSSFGLVSTVSIPGTPFGASTSGNNLAAEIGLGGGIAYQGCSIGNDFFCER